MSNTLTHSLLAHMEQVERETGIDVSDLAVVSEHQGRRVLRTLTDGDRKIYIVTDLLNCTRCGHVWTPRVKDRPKFCPKCNSPYWDKERQK